MQNRAGAPDHLGWALHQALAAWKHRFGRAMRDAGFPAFAEGRGTILMQIGPQGLEQSALVAQTGLTKQAVQQALDLLEAEGLMARVPDAADGRRRRVVLTEAGLEAFASADAAKRAIEAELTAVLGPDAVAILHHHLGRVVECLDPAPRSGSGPVGRKRA
jgi:DNA-binding MarR family transcriptional regulator